MEYLTNQEFPNLTKRILYAYPAAYPVFVPVRCPADEVSQKEFHEFMSCVLTLIYEEPEQFGFPILPDGYFAPGQLANTNPELMKAMDKIEGLFCNIIVSLVKVGQNGIPEASGMRVSKQSKALTKGVIKNLTAFGVNCSPEGDGYLLTSEQYPNMFSAFGAYAKEDSEASTKVDRVINFIYTKYFGRVYDACSFFHNLIKDRNELQKLEAFFSENGFTKGNSMLNAKTRFACTKWTKEYDKDQKATMSVCFNYRQKNQLILSFHLPNLKPMLTESFSTFSDSIQSFLFPRLNNCSGCGYCTQTDKTGKRNRLSGMVTYAGKTELKCPLFPNFNFSEINGEDMEQMRELLVFADKRMKPAKE